VSLASVLLVPRRRFRWRSNKVQVESGRRFRSRQSESHKAISARSCIGADQAEPRPRARPVPSRVPLVRFGDRSADTPRSKNARGAFLLRRRRSRAFLRFAFALPPRVCGIRASRSLRSSFLPVRPVPSRPVPSRPVPPLPLAARYSPPPSLPSPSPSSLPSRPPRGVDPSFFTFQNLLLRLATDLPAGVSTAIDTAARAERNADADDDAPTIDSPALLRPMPAA